ncbi:Methyl jasmonate esterase 1 [Linum perenne]
MVRHFVLVHGACHGAWCWYKVSAELKRAGHEVTTLDLAACGINPKRFEDVHSLVEYSEPLLTFLGSLGDKDKVVLVAHSMSGFSLCIAMERFPGKISVAVFVGATMLGPDLPYDVVAEEVLYIDCACYELLDFNNLSYRDCFVCFSIKNCHQQRTTWILNRYLGTTEFQ